MSDSKEYSFELKGHVAGHEDRWFSQDKVHYTNAKLLLDELLIVCQDINANWPVKENESIKAEDYPELFTLVKKRNLISDSVFLFSAMAIEGFLNFYGVLRLGEVVYKKNFERLNHISKLRLILLVCDSISIPDDHLLVKIAQKISSKRNELVHPKSREIDGCKRKILASIPKDAESAIVDMEDFFREFIKLVPEAYHLVP